MNKLKTKINMKKIKIIGLLGFVLCGLFVFAQPETYTVQKTYIDNNIKTNGVGSITGAIANTAFNYLLRNSQLYEYDITRPYKLGQVTIKDSVIYQALVDMTAGAWDSTKWYSLSLDTTSLSDRIDLKQDISDTSVYDASKWYVDSSIVAIIDTGYVKTTGDTMYGNLQVRDSIQAEMFTQYGTSDFYILSNYVTSNFYVNTRPSSSTNLTVSTGTNSSGLFYLTTGNSTGSLGTGDIHINTGYGIDASSGTTGNMYIETGLNSSVSSGTGYISLATGTCAGSSGLINIVSGISSGASSGDISIKSGTGSSQSGNVTINSGNSSILSGSITVKTGTSSNQSGNIDIYSGNGTTTDGDIRIGKGGSVTGDFHKAITSNMSIMLRDTSNGAICDNKKIPATMITGLASGDSSWVVATADTLITSKIKPSSEGVFSIFDTSSVPKSMFYLAPSIVAVSDPVTQVDYITVDKTGCMQLTHYNNHTTFLSCGNGGLFVSDSLGVNTFDVSAEDKYIRFKNTETVFFAVDSAEGTTIRYIDYDATQDTMLVYNPTTREINTRVLSLTNDWSLTGNTGTDSAANYVGTTDAKPLMFGTNGSAKMKLSRQGSILSLGALSLNNVFSGQGNIGLNYTGNINGTYMYGNIGLAAATITGSNLYSNIVGGGGTIQGGSNNNSNYINGTGIINGGGNAGNIIMSSGGISGSYSGTNIINTPYSIYGSSSYNLIFGPYAKMNRAANNTFAFNGSTGADYSYAFGDGTVTNQQHEFVCGRANDTVTVSGRLFSIGKGSNTNALTISATKTLVNTDSLKVDLLSYKAPTASSSFVYQDSLTKFVYKTKSIPSTYITGLTSGYWGTTLNSLSDSTTNNKIGSSTSYPIDFYTNNTLRWRMQGGTGFLGFGTTTPAVPLHIVKNVNSFAGGKCAQIKNSNSGSNAYTIMQIGNNTADLIGALGVTSSANTANMATIGGNGVFLTSNSTAYKVGIGVNLGCQIVASSATTVGFFTGATTYNINIDGQAAKTMGMIRNTTANTAGTSFTINSSGATSGANNKSGGDLILAPGVKTGIFSNSSVRVQTYGSNASSTSDNSLYDRASFMSCESVIDNTLDTLFRVTLGNDSMFTGTLNYNVRVIDNDSNQMEKGYHELMYIRTGNLELSNTDPQVMKQVLENGTLTTTFSYIFDYTNSYLYVCVNVNSTTHQALTTRGNMFVRCDLIGMGGRFTNLTEF